MNKLEPGLNFKYNPNKQIKNIIKLVDNQMKIIYYLAFPYTGKNKEDVMKTITEMRFTLEQRGLTVFSPLHHSNEYFQNIPKQKHEYWLKQDLAIMEALSNGDGHDGKEVFINNTTCKAWQCPMWDSGEIILMSKTAYRESQQQSPLKSNFSLDTEWRAIQRHGNYPIDIKAWNGRWNSQGCRQEYEKAKSKSIRILEAEAFVFDGVEVDL